jgi:PAS domain S-box-containing protein
MMNQITYPQIERVKTQIIDTALLLGTILGFVAYILSLTRLMKTGFEVSFVSDVFVLIALALVTAFRKKISLKTKSYIALVAVYLLFVVDTINLGVFSANKVLIILIPFAALMSFSLRRTIIISSFTITTFIALAYFHLSGFLKFPPQDNIDFSAWLINILLISVVALVIILVHLKFNNAYSVLISNLEGSNKIISEKERNYREIFNSSTDAIFIHELDGKIIDVNDSMLTMYGCERIDLPHLNISDLSSQDEGFRCDNIKMYFEKVNADIPQVFDWQARKKDGELFWVEVSLKKTKIGDSERILAIVRDITQKKEDALQLNLYRNHLEDLVSTRTDELKKTNEELKATLENLKETQAQLIESEKMASLGVLTAGVAHEINNPINYIYNGAAAIELIINEKDENDAEELKPYIEAINIGIKRVSDIVKSLNRYSRSENAAYTICNINEVIDECLIMLNNQHKGRIEIVKQYSNNVIEILANEGQLHQVFLNILYNAVQAIEDSGSISITTKMEGKSAIITIIDTGMGIAEENLHNIFDPFFTTKEPGKGTGLGLSITKNIINQHKGTILCTSKINQGTEFQIKLPLK